MSGRYDRNRDVAEGEVTLSTEVLNVTSLGGGLELRREKKKPFDRAKATEILELPEFVGDRRLNQSHVDGLVRAMQRGTFHAEWVSIITCFLETDGKTYRMNGQHTAWARMEMPDSWPCEVKCLEYVAKTEEDMRTLYSSIDRSSPRTKANVIDSYLAGTDQFGHLKSRVLRILPQGFSIWLWHTPHERKRHDGDDVAFLLKTEHFDLAIKVARFMNKQPDTQKCILRAAVVGAMFATFNRAPQIAEKFWAPVGDGLNFDKKSDPRLVLRNWLIQTAVGTGAGSRTDKKKVTQEYMVRACLVAWNAYRQNRPLQVIRPTERGRRLAAK